MNIRPGDLVWGSSNIWLRGLVQTVVVISNLKGEKVVEKMLFAASGVGEKGVRGGGRDGGVGGWRGEG